MAVIAKLKLLLSPGSRELARLQRRRKGLAFLRRFAFALSVLAFLVGFVGLAILPMFNQRRRTYIDENALLPAQVQSLYDVDDWQYFSNIESSMAVLKDAQSLDRATFVQNELVKLGMSANMQAYQPPNDNEHRYNMYTILRAPKGDGSESLVLSTSWYSQGNVYNPQGILFVLSMVLFWKRYAYWDKDMIFLFADTDLHGSAAWVSAYHGQTYYNGIRSETLSEHAGLIQAALGIDLQSAMFHSGLALHYESLNGQLSNLDFINTVVRIAQTNGVSITLHGLPLVDTNNLDYWTNLNRLLHGMSKLAMSSFGGSHAVFKQFGIDSLTLEGIESLESHNSLSIRQVGIVVELTFRSLNNLLERFHHAFFFYLLADCDHFISLSIYIPSIIALCISLILSSASLYTDTDASYSNTVAAKLIAKAAKDHPTHTKPGIVLKESTKVKEQLSIVSYTTYPRDVVSPALLLLFAHLLGVAILQLPSYLASLPFNILTQLSMMIIGPIFAATTIYPWIINAVKCNGPKTTILHYDHVDQEIRWRLLKSFTQSLSAAMLLSLATVNFSLAVGLATITIPLYFLLEQRRAWYMRLLQAILVISVSPPALVLTAMVAGYHADTMRVLHDVEMSWHHNGNWLWPVLCLFYFPLNTVYLTLVTTS